MFHYILFYRIKILLIKQKSVKKFIVVFETDKAKRRNPPYVRLLAAGRSVDPLGSACHDLGVFERRGGAGGRVFTHRGAGGGFPRFFHPIYLPLPTHS